MRLFRTTNRKTYFGAAPTGISQEVRNGNGASVLSAAAPPPNATFCLAPSAVPGLL